MGMRMTPRFSHLTVFGGVSLDTVVTVPRFLAGDEKVWARVVGRFPGGMGANVAAAYAVLGGEVALVSAVGRDAAGAASLATLRRLKVDISRVAERPGSTFETLAMIDGSGEKAMLLMEAPDLVTPGDLTIDEPRPGIDAIHVVPGRFSPAIEEIARWHRLGVHTSFDLEPSMLERGLDYRAVLDAATVLFCGETAIRMMSSARTPEERLRDLLDLGPDIAVLTRGRGGAMAATREGALLDRPGMAVRPVNTTGAGDVFAGTFLFGLSRRWPAELCLATANFAGGRCVESYASQDPEFSLASLEALPEFSAHITSKQGLR
jgi:sugar/nucleoside kinase (ribokinase family)